MPSKAIINADLMSKSTLWVISKCSAWQPANFAKDEATRDETIHGKKAAYCMLPAIATSRAKTAAARGVPKTAAKPALIPQVIIIRLSFLSSLKMLPKRPATLPPNWSAAPSRPAEPPVR